jgi:hypothetical protein
MRRVPVVEVFVGAAEGDKLGVKLGLFRGVEHCERFEDRAVMGAEGVQPVACGAVAERESAWRDVSDETLSPSSS